MVDCQQEGSVPESEAEPALTSVKDAISLRAIACAVVLGSAISCANMYIGLQAGTVNSMPTQSVVLAFAFFRSIQRHLSRPLSPEEITVIEVSAGGLGLAPSRSASPGSFQLSNFS